MRPEDLKERGMDNGFVFTATRSSGPGGQNVNKVNTRIELRFNISSSDLLSEDEKKMIFEKLSNRINNEGELIISSQSDRSQLMNKNNAVEKFYELVSKALTVKAKRKLTSPTASSRLKRIEKKKLRSSIKKLRNLSSGNPAE